MKYSIQSTFNNSLANAYFSMSWASHRKTVRIPFIRVSETIKKCLYKFSYTTDYRLLYNQFKFDQMNSLLWIGLAKFKSDFFLSRFCDYVRNIWRFHKEETKTIQISIFPFRVQCLTTTMVYRNNKFSIKKFSDWNVHKPHTPNCFWENNIIDIYVPVNSMFQCISKTNNVDLWFKCR